MFIIIAVSISQIYAQYSTSLHVARLRTRLPDLERVNRNIEEYRKSDARLTILDRNNRPVSGIIVHINQITNDFLFGVTPEYFIFPETVKLAGASESVESEKIFHRTRWTLLSDEKVEQLKGLIDNLGLNMLNLNYFYWNDYEPLHGFFPVDEPAMKVADWALSRGYILKGHPLVWANRNDGSAAWVSELMKQDPEEARQALENSVRRKVRMFKGKIKIWDVVNEPIRNQLFAQIDPDFILHAFQWTKEEDPDALLTYNETGLIGNDDRIDAFYDLIKDALDKGAHIDIIGIQAHQQGNWFLSVDKIYQNLDKLAEFGIPLHITEVTVPLGNEMVHPMGLSFGEIDERLQGEWLRTYYRIFFSHPAVTGLNYWNIYQAWMPGADLVREDLSEKPIYKAMQDLLKNEWKTRLHESTNAGGTIAFRGFHGKYVVYAKDKNGNEKTWSIHVKKDEVNNFRLSY